MRLFKVIAFPLLWPLLVLATLFAWTSKALNDWRLAVIFLRAGRDYDNERDS